LILIQIESLEDMVGRCMPNSGYGGCPGTIFMTIGHLQHWFGSFITELVSRNPTRGIPALEDGSLAKLLILYYFWVLWVFETAKTSFSRNDLEIKIYFDFGTFSYNLRNTRLTTIIDYRSWDNYRYVLLNSHPCTL